MDCDNTDCRVIPQSLRFCGSQVGQELMFLASSQVMLLPLGWGNISRTSDLGNSLFNRGKPSFALSGISESFIYTYYAGTLEAPRGTMCAARLQLICS